MIVGIDPKVDYAFKRVFGREQNQAILVDLLDAVLQEPPPRRLQALELLNPFQDKDYLEDKLSVLDVKARDQSGRQWDGANETGLRFARGVHNVEYFRDVQPILERSCAVCHTARDGKRPAGNLNLDADGEMIQHEQHGKFPGTYYRLALDDHARFGHKPVGWDSWGYPNASRYVRMFQ